MERRCRHEQGPPTLRTLPVTLRNAGGIGSKLVNARTAEGRSVPTAGQAQCWALVLMIPGNHPTLRQCPSYC